MRTLVCALALFFAHVDIVAAQDSCGTSYPADSATLAAAWLPDLEKFNAAIPSLSPSEEKWLDDELVGDGRRPVIAVSSREYAIREAKNNATTLMWSLRHVVSTDDKEKQQANWLLFAYALIELDAGNHIARLVEEKIIERGAVPGEWLIWPRSTVVESVVGRRTLWAQHVLVCTIPNVSGIALQ